MAQLELALGDVRVRIPWQGTSPRALTRAQISLSFERERQGHEVDPLQYDLFGGGVRGGHLGQRGFAYGGAPSLLPLKEV